MESPGFETRVKKQKHLLKMLLKSEEWGTVSTQLHRVLMIRAFQVVSRSGP
jgi:hypothetical protein